MKLVSWAHSVFRWAFSPLYLLSLIDSHILKLPAHFLKLSLPNIQKLQKPQSRINQEAANIRISWAHICVSLAEYQSSFQFIYQIFLKRKTNPIHVSDNKSPRCALLLQTNRGRLNPHSALINVVTLCFPFFKNPPLRAFWKTSICRSTLCHLCVDEVPHISRSSSQSKHTSCLSAWLNPHLLGNTVIVQLDISHFLPVECILLLPGSRVFRPIGALAAWLKGTI